MLISLLIIAGIVFIVLNFGWFIKAVISNGLRSIMFRQMQLLGQSNKAYIIIIGSLLNANSLSIMAVEYFSWDSRIGLSA
jgi:hypothetical protein